MKYLIANWKANKTYGQAQEWINSFLKNDFTGIESRTEIIICPPFPFIVALHEKTVSLPFIKIGSQDISQFGSGAHTGEVTANILGGLIDYAIIGHSERRQNNNETDAVLTEKVSQAVANQIKPIFCVRNASDPIAGDISLLAYEPVESISTGNNKTVEEILTIKRQVRLSGLPFLYGGSVNSGNAQGYLSHPEIDGLLIGAASLDSAEFYKIVRLALKS